MNQRYHRIFTQLIFIAVLPWAFENLKHGRYILHILYITWTTLTSVKKVCQSINYFTKLNESFDLPVALGDQQCQYPQGILKICWKFHGNPSKNRKHKYHRGSSGIVRDHPVIWKTLMLFWPKSRCFDYLYQDAEMLLRNYPVQATICPYGDSSSDEESNDEEEEEAEKELN
uniref:Ripply transcriptional repressor 2 n=1 Tax=Amphiprion percula TaxID=161767 RepID=A0A3P8U3S0_AMPPE